MAQSSVSPTLLSKQYSRQIKNNENIIYIGSVIREADFTYIFKDPS